MPTTVLAVSRSQFSPFNRSAGLELRVLVHEALLPAEPENCAELYNSVWKDPINLEPSK